MKVICYASRTLTSADRNYYLHSGKLEFLTWKWSVTEKFQDYLYYANEFTVYSDNNPLLYVTSTAKLNATGMRWVSELTDFNFKVKYRLGKRSQDCDYLSQIPVEDKFSSYTEENNLDNFKIFVNSISNVENNWLTVTAKQPEILETYLNLKPDKEPIKIDCETQKYEQLNNKIISSIFEAVYHKTNPVLKIKNQIVEKAKLFKLLAISKNE